jgi:tRNA modification GTPase
VSQRDTIAAVASPPGRSLRGIVRVSGPATLDALRLRIRPAPAGAGASRGRFDLGGADIPILLLTFAAPASYTGEDAAELQLPGNPDLLTCALERLCALPGVRPANPGEFTARACLNGKLTIEQAEGVAALIAADDDSQRRAAEALLTGATGERYRALADRMAHTLALVEAGIDFTDQEDVVAIAPDPLRLALDEQLDAIDRLAGPEIACAPCETPSVVLVGAPNAGKSTLFNALLGRPRAIVSTTPGATRDALREPIEIAGVRATLVDLAGLDESLTERSGIDAGAQRIARAAIASAQVVVVCDPDGRFGLASLAPPGAVTLRVRTKADLPSSSGHDAFSEALRVCALDGWNLGALRRAIGDAGAAARGDPSRLVVPRHRAALTRARGSVTAARNTAIASAGSDRLGDEELIADAMRAALDAMGEITGRVSPDDVLGRIFSSFCIGK